MLEFWTSLLQDSLVNRLVADEEDSIQNDFNDDSEDVEYVESTPLLSSIKPEFQGHSGLVGLPKGYFALQLSQDICTEISLLYSAIRSIYRCKHRIQMTRHPEGDLSE